LAGAFHCGEQGARREGAASAALFIATLHRLRLRFHYVMRLRHRVVVMVMIMVVMDDHYVVRFHHVRLCHFLHGHFRILSKGWDGEAERSDSRECNSKFVHGLSLWLS
jgi:hypothetical protein